MYESVVLSMLFFVHDTATTEIYPYGHTLSLPDALPIYLHRAVGPDVRLAAGAREPQPRDPLLHDPALRGQVGAVPVGQGDQGGPEPRGRRTEEHTSELQSLMRISYAVFCLKNKTKYKKLHTDTIK